MKKIGLIGGISWTSTIDYYRIINKEINEQLGGLHFAECIIYSVNFEQFSRYNAAHDWNGSFELLANAGRQLEKAGADMLLLCANTAHIVAERLAAAIALPLIDIRTVMAEALLARKINTIGLLGTVFTMELDFYKNKIAEYGITTIIPAEQSDRDYIEHTLLHELGSGIIKDTTKKEYIRIANELIGNGAEAIVLGCTEIPLLLSQEDFAVPIFNSTALHASAAVAAALA